MKQIICIGELSLDIVLDESGNTLGDMPGGRIANAAMILGRGGANVLMASEAATDIPGDIVVGRLESAGVDLRSVDRPTEQRTPIHIMQAPRLTRYEDYPEQAFDIIWPRIEEGDIIVFGGYYALDKRMRGRMSKLLANAAERKAVMVYLPGYLPELEPRITRVMPEILENLEMADIVVSRTADLAQIFGDIAAADSYRDHVSFYCRSLVNIDPSGRLEYFGGNECSAVAVDADACGTLLWQAGALAGLLKVVAAGNYSAGDFEAPSETVRAAILDSAAASAVASHASATASWQLIPALA